MTLLVLAYIVVVAWLAVYASFEFRLLLYYFAVARRRPARPAAEVRDEALPTVTVQVPLYNEPGAAAFIIDAVCALDYPRARLQIQVLDDSTDATVRIVDARVHWHAERGVDITVRRRSNRAGFKAGALSEAMPSARGELIAIFDADFHPAPTFLRDVLRRGAFADAEVGFVQTRWGHNNRGASLLTLAQALLIDRHFIVEKPTRQELGWVTTFNGSAGIWRRSAIDRAGGWQIDTLTEDCDLSYRLAAHGMRGAYALDVEVAAELPNDVIAYKVQQRRWAIGATQTLRKLHQVLRSTSLKSRGAELISLAGYWVQLGGLVNLLLWPFFVYFLSHDAIFAVGQVVVMLASLAMPCCLATVVLQRDGKLGARSVLEVLSALALGFGMIVAASFALIEALMPRKQWGFERTPKTGSEGEAQLPRSFYGELLLTAYCFGAAVVLTSAGYAVFAIPLLTWGLCVFALVFEQSRLLLARRHELNRASLG